MKRANSQPLDPKELSSISWEIEGKVYSIKIPNGKETAYRKANLLIKDKFSEWKQKTVTRNEDSNFRDMNLVAVEAMVDALTMREEYEKLFNLISTNLSKLQEQISNNTDMQV